MPFKIYTFEVTFSGVSRMFNLIAQQDDDAWGAATAKARTLHQYRPTGLKMIASRNFEEHELKWSVAQLLSQLAVYTPDDAKNKRRISL